MEQHSGKWFYARELYKLLGETNTNLHMSLNSLVNRGILIKRIRGMYFQFTLSSEFLSVS